MLSTLRRGSGGIQALMGGIVLVIIASFAFEYKGRAAHFNNECAVEVLGRCVPPRDFNTAFRFAVPPNVSPKQIKQLGLRKMVLDGLVERELLRHEASLLGVSISESEVDDELQHGRFHYSQPAGQFATQNMVQHFPVTNPKTQQFDYDIYKRTVKNYTRMSGKDFKQMQTDELVAARMRELVKMPIRVSDNEAYAQFEYAKSRAVVRTGQLRSAWFSRYVTPVTEDDVTAYISAHEAELAEAQAQNKDAAAALAPAAPAASTDHATPGAEPPAAATPAPAAEGCTLVSEIFLGYPPAADASDEAATQAKARDVKKQVSQGRAFELLARTYSTSPTASSGGLRGCLRASDGEEASALLASTALLKTGDVSDPLVLPHGVYVIKVEARLDPTAAETAEKRAQARPLAARALADARVARFANDLLTAVKGGQSMADAMTALTAAALKEAKNPPDLAKEIESQALEAHDRPRVDISPGFSRVDGVNPIPNLAGDVAAKQLCFTLDAPEQLYPEPLATRDGMVVVQLKEKTVASRADFDKTKPEILRELRENLQDDALARYVQGLREKAKDAIIFNPRFLDSATEAPADES
jgi:peptidyl-prolyl cis-trans isomerase D